MAYYYNSGGFFQGLPSFTKNVLLANIVIYIACLIKPEAMYQYFALYPVSSGLFRFWQPLTYMFMHGGFWHLFLNMYCLLMFGLALERVWGPKKLAKFYFISGIGAAAFHVLIETIFRGGATASLVGASGAIYGLILGYAMLYPESRMTLLFPPISFTAKWMVVIFIFIELLTGMSLSDGVAHFAHLGGMLVGYIMILIWKKKQTLYEWEY